MTGEYRGREINNFLGSAHLFASAVGRIIEVKMWREAVGKNANFNQLKLLKLLGITGSHTVSDVAAFLGVSKAAASKAVDRLVRHLLVRRCQGEQDRRAMHLSLTDHGRRILETYEQLAQRKLQEAFGATDLEVLRKAEGILDQLSAAIIDGNLRPGAICAQCGIYFRDDCLLRMQEGRQCLYMHPGKGSGKRVEPNRSASRNEVLSPPISEVPGC
jgi:DNA-binding MarR family transcriptional regulator